MGVVSERVDEGDCGDERDQNIAIENIAIESWHQAKMAAELTQAAVQRLQISVMGCQALVDHSRAQVTASHALLDSLRREGGT
jgi:hypothetical protein